MLIASVPCERPSAVWVYGVALKREALTVLVELQSLELVHAVYLHNLLIFTETF